MRPSEEREREREKLQAQKKKKSIKQKGKYLPPMLQEIPASRRPCVSSSFVLAAVRNLNADAISITLSTH